MGFYIRAMKFLMCEKKGGQIVCLGICDEMQRV